MCGQTVMSLLHVPLSFYRLKDQLINQENNLQTNQ